MRLIKIIGGLGNQMFIYAFYLKMKKQYPNTRIDLSDMMHYHVHHGYEMNRIFRLPKTEFCISRPLKKVMEFLFFKKIYERKQQPDTLAPYEKKYVWPLLYFKGFYQSERFFVDIANEIRDAFSFDVAQCNEATLQMLQQIDSTKNAVSIHIRRGDYLLPKHWENTGSICQSTYYQNAISAMNEKISEPTYFVFSDDMEWIKKNLSLPNATYIDWNKGDNSWQDMMLMSHCRHHIICNSTFSWWGAWLNPREDKIVLAPSRWFRNSETPYIYPPQWIKISIN